MAEITVDTEGTEPKTFDEAYVKGLRGEAASNRIAAKEAKEQVEALTAQVNGFKDKDKSELEKATEERTRLERELEDAKKATAEIMVKSQVFAEAGKLGIIDPDAAFRLLDLSEIDDKGVRKALDKLVKEKPYLLKSESPPPAPGTGGIPVGGTAKPSLEGVIAGALQKGTPK